MVWQGKCFLVGAKVKFKQFRLPDGTVFHARSRTEFDLLSREFLRNDIYDRHGVELHDGDCILDVGANIGFFAHHISKRIRDATMYCFEPIPDTFACLERNLTGLTGSKISAFNFGIADYCGRTEFTHYPLASVGSRLTPDNSAAYREFTRRYILNEIQERHFLLSKLVDWTPRWFWWPGTEVIRRIVNRSVRIECELRDLSGFLTEKNINHVDLLKIDVEGAEQSVLNGIRNEDWPNIRQLVIETHHGREHAEDMAEQLRQRGYLVTAEPTEWCGARQDEQPPEFLFMLYARRPA